MLLSRIAPSTPEEFAAELAEAALRNKRIAIVGNDSKLGMAGPAVETETVLSSTRLARVLQYEPKDLTVSVEAGMPFPDLQALLAQNGQMIALDPPHAASATIGGVVASDSSGPLRAGYGTARDLVIGMTFATLDGKLVRSGGMVVKNVAGLDMSKLMIGSFGTLAAITSVNFRVHSLPARTETFLFAPGTLDEALDWRRALRAGPLQPIACELLSPGAASRLGWRGLLIAVLAAGSEKALDRYRAAWPVAERITGETARTFWCGIREMFHECMRAEPNGLVLKVSTTLSDMAGVWRELKDEDIAVGRFLSGVTWAFQRDTALASALLAGWAQRGWPSVVAYASHEFRMEQTLWYLPEDPAGQTAFEVMQKVKRMFDPQQILNRGRLYGRI
jgi:glycolate oxidase FAD binding subunit